MQSILQYRRFRRRLEGQIERHGLERVASSSVRPHPALTLSLSPSTHHLQEIRNDAVMSERDHPLEEKRSENVNSAHELDAEVSRTSASAPREVDVETRHLVVGDDQNPENTRESQNRIGTGSTALTKGIRVDTEPHLDLELPRSSSSSSSSSSVSTHGQVPVGLTTVSTHRTQMSTGASIGHTLTGVDVHSPRTNEKGHDSGSHVFVVGYQGLDDTLNPHNWSKPRRMCYTLLIALIGLIVGFASSVDSAAAPQAAEEFHVSEVTESLATSMYLLGFGLGAPFAAPLSETFGRNVVYIATLSLFMVWVMASALAPNIGAQLVFRLLAGFFGSTPLTCAGGSISDMWDATERTAIFPVFANSAFWGPILGPVIGGFIAQSTVLSWRWCEWITLIWSGLILMLVVLFLPETYAPILLKWKATHLRAITGDERYMSEMEVRNTKLSDRIIANMYRPILLFAFEPIAILFTLYLSVVYIVLFTFLTGFEFIFSETYGLSQGLTYLIFVALGVGFAGASAFVPWVYKSYRRSLREAESRGGTHLPPERRLIFAMLGAPWLPIGLFWMGWTAYPSVSVWAPILSCIPTGFAILGIFISTYQYLIDAYEAHAASALVGVTFVRYIVAAGMIPASIPFYKNLGVHWTLTVLGGISAAMAPVPFIFWMYGARIRKHSRYATEES